MIRPELPDSESAFPIIIAGSPRSGTSLLHWALCEHDAVWGSEESELMGPLVSQLDAVYEQARRYEDRNWLDAQDVDRDAFFAFMGIGVNALYASRAGSRHWVEQTASNVWWLPKIRMLLPNARFLFIHRDGRQAIASMMSMWGWSFAKSLKVWTGANRKALAFELQYPNAILRVPYENLAREPQAALAATWAFLDLDPCPDSVRFVTEREPINASPDFASQTRLEKLEPRYRAWSKRRRARFDAAAGEIMAVLGYGSD